MDTQQLFEVLPRWSNRVTVTPEKGCWEWTGTLDRDGYAEASTVKVPNTSRGHRISYTLLVGAIPEGLTLDHECEVRHCINPDHLDPCTFVDNVKRAAYRRGLRSLWHGPQATEYQLRMAKGVCLKGHVLSEVGILTKSNKSGVRCRACQHETQRKNRKKAGIVTGEARGAYGDRDPNRKKSRYRGVSWSKTQEKWLVAVYHGGKNYYGGTFKAELEDKAGEIATKLKADLVKGVHPK